MKLDVSRLPREGSWGEGNALDLAFVPLSLRDTIEKIARLGLIKTSPSFGFAAAYPTDEQFFDWNWDDPYDFTWLVAGWGPESDRYIANAVRKLRAALRENMDTLMIRIASPDEFKDVVESADADGNFQWGDFPWGGATFVEVGDLIIPCAVSCLLEVEDDAVAKLIGGFIGAEILKCTKPEEFGPNS